MTCQRFLYSDSYSLAYSTHRTTVHCHRKTSKCNIAMIYKKTSLKYNIKAQWRLAAPLGMGSCRGSPWGWQERDSPVRETQDPWQGIGHLHEDREVLRPVRDISPQVRPRFSKLVACKLHINWFPLTFLAKWITEIHEKCHTSRYLTLHFFIKLGNIKMS